MDRPARMVVRGLIGLLIGLVYYFLYVVLLPRFLIPLLVAEPETIYSPSVVEASVIILIMVSIFERVLEHPVAAAFRLVSKVLGVIILFYITNGGLITGSVEYAGEVLYATVDLRILFYVIVAGSLVGGLVDAGSAIVRYSDSGARR
ncbi:MAG: hypothetical protein GSR73_02900 [Desulfurococcales archaeon]|nr:hypothetical protein [Desulfurococcales archaeon]